MLLNYYWYNPVNYWYWSLSIQGTQTKKLFENFETYILDFGLYTFFLKWSISFGRSPDHQAINKHGGIANNLDFSIFGCLSYVNSTYAPRKTYFGSFNTHIGRNPASTIVFIYQLPQSGQNPNKSVAIRTCMLFSAEHCSSSTSS